MDFTDAWPLTLITPQTRCSQWMCDRHRPYSFAFPISQRLC
jgi:hypothetical protein